MWQFCVTSGQTFKALFKYYLIISIDYLGYKMCIKYGLQFTDIIKKYCLWHFVALFWTSISATQILVSD